MINIEVYSTRVAIRSQEPLTVGLAGGQVHFRFSDQWENLTRTVVFRQGDVTRDVVGVTDEAVIPHEVLQLPGVPVSIGVYGSSADGSLVIPTVWTETAPVEEGADPSGDPSTEPTLPVYQQIQGQVDNNKPLVVEIYGGGTVNSYAASHAVKDIYNAYMAGRPVVAKYQQLVLPLMRINQEIAQFGGVDAGTVYVISVSSSGTQFKTWQGADSATVETQGAAVEELQRTARQHTVTLDRQQTVISDHTERLNALEASGGGSGGGGSGAPGKSAYEYAQEGGFTGTEEEFAQVLAGNPIQAARDAASLGAELAGASGWTLGAGWSGDFAKGFTHTSGSTEPLTFTPSGMTAGKLYQVTFRSSVAMTTTNLFVSVGNSAQFNLYGDDSDGKTGIGVLAADTSGLVFTPAAGFTGTLTEISLREITGTYEAVRQYFDTNGAVSFEIHVTPRGLQNVFLGPMVGQNNTSGHENTAVGVNALMRNTSGFWNSAFGKDCLKNNTAGSRNIAIGYNSLLNNQVGQRNIAIGTFTMTQMQSGNWNIAIGADSMNTATGGNKNTAIGFNTLTHNAADNNVAVGADVLSKNTTGGRNVGIGQGALGKNTTGGDNVCIGYNAGIANTTASGNVGIGWASLYKNQTGARNTVIGYAAGKSLTTGKLNILIGSEVEADTPTTDYQLNIGNLLKGSVNPNDRYLTVEGGLRLPQIPTVAPGNNGVWNNGGVLMMGDGGLDTLVQAVISALPVYNGEVE